MADIIPSTIFRPETMEVSDLGKTRPESFIKMDKDSKVLMLLRRAQEIPDTLGNASRQAAAQRSSITVA